MASGTKNLGLVKAIHAGSIAPINTYMLWYNTLTHLHYYHNGTDWVELSSGSSGGSGITREFIYKPGGLASENVYSDFELLMTDLEAYTGRKFLTIDRSLLSFAVDAEIPPRNPAINGGMWNFIDTIITISIKSLLISPNTQVTVNDGNKWLFPFLAIDLCSFKFKNTVWPVFESTTDFTVMNLTGGAQMYGVGVTMFHITSNHKFLLTLGDKSSVTASIPELFGITATGNMELVLEGSSEFEKENIRASDPLATMNVFNRSADALFKATHPGFAGNIINNFSGGTAFCKTYGMTPAALLTIVHNMDTFDLQVTLLDQSTLPGQSFPLVVPTDVELIYSDVNTILLKEQHGNTYNIRVLIQKIKNNIES